MSIAQYIQHEVFLARAKEQGVLVVYDPDRRYRDLCTDLTADELLVVDGSESSIESREAAIEALTSPEGVPGGKSLLVYLSNPAPVTDQDRQVDPFAHLAYCGAAFPSSDGDEYLNLCLKYRPDHEREIRQVFAENPNPEFAVVDNVGGGISWPTLQHLLGAASASEILTALMAPNDKQKEALGQSKTWVTEAKSLLRSVLGQSLRTRAKSVGPIADEVWRFVLFSEFVFDLPEPLPAALADVPRAESSAQLLVESLCDRLRNDRRSQSIYIERAEAVEEELNLSAHCVDIKDLGKRDTFPFEERSIFARAVEAVQCGDLEAVHAIIYRQAESIWLGRGESQAQWELLRSAVELIDSCDENEQALPRQSGDQASLLAFYRSSLRECDRLQREFEQAYSEHLDLEGSGVLAPVIEAARNRYRRLAERTQVFFTEHLQRSGWPPIDGLANADAFDRLVAPKLLERGRRVAYLMVDALRYELGLALYQQLAEDDVTEIKAAYAQLPTVTLVGMNSLLPGAGQGLSLAEEDGKPVSELDGVRLKTVAHRMAVFKRHYGDRFQELELNKFVRGRAKVEETVDLLVLRSVDIDSHLENDPESTLSLLQDTLKRIRVAINKLRKARFQDVVIVTDHGFFLNAQGDAGDLCTKPAGTWVNVHERALLGSGTPDDHNFVLDADRVGIRGDFPQLAGPRTMAPYSRGMLYFHGGASLQEAVVPVITIVLKEQEKPAAQIARVELNYKQGSSKVTTRRPVVEVSLEGDMFAASQETCFEILLEAQKRNGDVVGEAAIGGPVNAATGTIELRPGDSLKVAIRMQEEFEGKFKLKALDPKTSEVFAEIALETDYTV